MAINKDFYKFEEGITSGRLANLIGAELISGSPNQIIDDVGSFANAGMAHLTYLNDPKLTKYGQPRGAVVITNADCASLIHSSNICMILKSPRVGFASALANLIKTTVEKKPVASISDTAALCENVDVHPSATIMSGVKVGSNTLISPGAIICPNVQIGKNCSIGANVVISFSIIGDNVQISSGSVIGDSGFGFEKTKSGVVQIPHVGLVEVGNYVSIGSNCAIDRGSLGDTKIGANVMIDNLCHIAHNVSIGEGSVVAGQCGISGSVEVGKDVLMGGQVGIAPHLVIGDGAVLTAKSGVTKDVAPGIRCRFSSGQSSRVLAQKAKQRRQ